MNLQVGLLSLTSFKILILKVIVPPVLKFTVLAAQPVWFGG